MLRSGLILILSMIIVVGAAVTTKDDEGGEAVAPASGTTSTTTPPTATTTTTTRAGSELRAKALISETGVVVAVRAQTSRGYLVTTTCGSSQFVNSGTPVFDVSVVLDPGHGGEVDTGAVAPTGLIERDINLTLAMAVEQKMVARGVSTLLTRTGNYTVPLWVRANLADVVGADVLVSIHHNAPTPGVSGEPGTEVFIQTAKHDSRRLGGLLYEHTFKALDRIDSVTWHAAPDAGVLLVHNTRGVDTYGMIRLPETTAALIELAYINSREEAEFLETDLYIELASEALADAIEEYLTTDSPGSGFIEEPRVFNAQPSVARSVCEDTPLG